MRAPPIANRLELLSAPFIEIRNAYDEIDLEELGDDDLETYIQYDGIAEGDQLRIHWRGATATGEALDSVGTVVEVEQPDFDPLKKRLRVLIGNRYVSQGDQGYAFYYYERISGSPAESLRTFSFVGVRPHRMEHMPVTQAVESHALHIDPDALGSSGATFVAPPYAAMQEGDTVTLVFRGYEASGDFDEEKRYALKVEKDLIGYSLNWKVPKGQFNFIKKGSAQVHYQIDFVGSATPLEGPVQTYWIDSIPTEPALLPALEIEGYTGGSLDPEMFPDGLMVRVPAYPGLHTADWTLLHVNDEPGAAVLRADLTTLAVGVQGVQLDASVLQGATRLAMGYQVGREGLGLSGQLLDIEVLQPRHLRPVVVQDGNLENPDASTGELLEPGAMGRTGKTVSWLNLFEKPVQVERFTLDQPGQSASSYSVQQNRYDGLGRLTQEIDPRKASTHFAYDLFDRKVDETLADGSVVHRDYASHSGEDLPVLIQVGDKVLGEQVFDGLDRMVVSITGGRKRQMFYQPGQRQPETVITPAGQTIHYQYNPKLNAEPVTRKVVDTGPQEAAQSFEASYEYDPKNARLSTAVEGGELLERTYFSTGAIRTEVRNDHVMHYQTSLRERALTYTDVLGQVQRYVYNAAGQLELTTLGELTAHFTYDTLGRQFKIDTRDAEQFLTTELRYDAFDREVSRTFTMSDTGQSLTQEYDVRDALTSRTLHEGEHLLRKETYDYDDRGRLEAYTSDGELSPVDPFGKVIREQYFRFDDIDNITRVLTVFPGGSNTARYVFDNAQDPAQLTGIENDHPDYLEGNVALVYDANGCLIKDEAGRALKYDGLNRLINVTVPASDDLPEQTSRYGYDPVDRLASQEK